jgi:hypothetical protein
VFDVSGRLVKHLFEGDFLPGAEKVVWNCKDSEGARVRPGVYLARCSRPGGRMTVKAVVTY